MTWTEWAIVFFVIQIIHGLGTWKLYKKAGYDSWNAFVPIYNAVTLMKIINRSPYWTILLFLPMINVIMFPIIWVETSRSFGKNSYLDTFLAVISLGFYNYYLNYFAEINHIKNKDRIPKSSSGEWVNSILFAIVAATLVHTYFIQPYVIPSSSLEKSLLVGDFLLVSKYNFGARAPMTAVAAPMVHDTIPIIKKKSYLFNDEDAHQKTSWLNKLQFPYFRLPGFDTIDRNEIVVFNSPADSTDNINIFSSDRNYNKPIDKKINLVKRCVGTPGDTLEIKNGFVYINGEKNILPDRAALQFSYFVQPKRNQFNVKLIKERYDITDPFQIINNQNTYYFSAISDEALNKFQNHPNVSSITPNKEEDGARNPNIFPHHPDYQWNNDFFGPLYIPKKGQTIDLNLKVLPLYKRLISVYEKNDLEIIGDDIYMNGNLVTTYTFKQNYYWMMGDNRHNSLDARAWGFVPFDHVVGKPIFIWMSWDGIKNPRWKRFFTTVHGSGEPISFLIPFLIVLSIWYGFNKWRRRNKKIN